VAEGFAGLDAFGQIAAASLGAAVGFTVFERAGVLFAQANCFT
jgi:hypothetical protein